MKFIFGFVLGAFCIMFMISITGGKPRWVFQDEAVKFGHAEYYLDENLNKQWRWK